MVSSYSCFAGTSQDWGQVCLFFIDKIYQDRKKKTFNVQNMYQTPHSQDKMDIIYMFGATGEGGRDCIAWNV